MGSCESTTNEEEGEWIEAQDQDRPLLNDPIGSPGSEMNEEKGELSQRQDQDDPLLIDILRPFGLETNEEEGEWIVPEDQDGPFFNDLILEKVFEYVRRWDLLACRGVCKKWNELTVPFTRPKFTVGIQLCNRWLKYPRYPDEESTRRVEDFVAIFRRNELGNPFSKFKLGPLCTREGFGQEFLKLCGDTTTELDLCQDEEENEIFKVEDVSELLRSMKKLEKLTMSEKLVTDSGNVVELFPGSKPKLNSFKSFTLVPYISDGLRESCPTFLEELLTAAENISDLSVAEYWFHSAEGFDENYHSNGFHALTLIETVGRESSIRKLTLGAVRMRPDVELLRRLAGKMNGLQLKALSFCMDLDEEESDHFELVWLFKDTLHFLQKFFSPSSSFINFPKMPKLTYLFLQISKNFDSSLVNLNKIFPILKELHLLCQYEEDGDQVCNEFLPQSEPCLTVKSFSLLSGLHLTINAFNHVLTIFPRLTNLVLDVKVDASEIMRQIWTQMTQLEFLSISGNLQTVESVDSLFSGISTESILEISDVVKDLYKITVQSRRYIILNLKNQHCRLPSIGNLTNLRHLQLEVFGEENESRLSDVSGFLGIYSLKHLNRLVVYECEMTKTCCEILTTEMEVGLESWTFGTTEGEAIIPDQAC